MPAGQWAAGRAVCTTSNRLQLQAAFEDLLLARVGPPEVVTASSYVVNCFEQQWWVAWERDRQRCLERMDRGFWRDR